jgi:hypothetical protein
MVTQDRLDDAFDGLRRILQTEIKKEKNPNSEVINYNVLMLSGLTMLESLLTDIKRIADAQQFMSDKIKQNELDGWQGR